MATWSSSLYNNKTPAGTGHGPYQLTQHLHATVSVPATLAANDVLNFGYLPNNAIVASMVLKAATQLDSNGSPTLSIDMGVVGTAQLFKAAITTVGRTAGASADIGTGLAAAGYLYKNTSGAKQLVIGTVHAAAATAVAGTLELDVEYYLEDTVGSPA
ncbi:MAG TPA: hypothetical protein VII73_07445 [Caulobacteraceae bacterium]